MMTPTPGRTTAIFEGGGDIIKLMVVLARAKAELMRVQGERDKVKEGRAIAKEGKAIG
jgi:hypothetical protein